MSILWGQGPCTEEAPCHSPVLLTAFLDPSPHTPPRRSLWASWLLATPGALGSSFLPHRPGTQYHFSSPPSLNHLLLPLGHIYPFCSRWQSSSACGILPMASPYEWYPHQIGTSPSEQDWTACSGTFSRATPWQLSQSYLFLAAASPTGWGYSGEQQEDFFTLVQSLTEEVRSALFFFHVP